jgi:hypothetical protein
MAVTAGGNANMASGYSATVGGGKLNTASGSHATVLGGYNSTASGAYSLAAGNGANATHLGAFVWADRSQIDPDFDFSSTRDNQFNIRAAGGTRIFSNSTVTTGVELLPGATAWSVLSDRALKENVTPVDGTEIVHRLSRIPLSTWNLTSQNPSIRHLGPMAQDFYAAFGLGEDERHISTLDADGVALAAIQGLYQMLQEKQAALATQQAEIERLALRLMTLERAMARASSPVVWNGK